ncbi:hypothetical protein Q6312_28030, partial [Klebsiella pneumoniae]|uniref:hypothetical protein n=1 Tax=Klebsiella pneumoniae TaxID=573 RepID=UPI00272F97EA
MLNNFTLISIEMISPKAPDKPVATILPIPHQRASKPGVGQSVLCLALKHTRSISTNALRIISDGSEFSPLDEAAIHAAIDYFREQ